MTTTALVLIDIQNDYFPGGTMELVGPDAAAKAAALLLETFRQKALPVVHVQHIAKRPGANAVDVVNAVLAKVDTLHGSLLPAEVEVSITRDVMFCGPILMPL